MPTTEEPVDMRRFSGGRYANARSLTTESRRWVEAAVALLGGAATQAPPDGTPTAAALADLGWQLHSTLAVHRRNIAMVQCGLGIDRHLLGTPHTRGVVVCRLRSSRCV